MSDLINRKIAESRRLLQNQYAYLNDAGGFDAVEACSEAEATSTSPSAEAISESRRQLKDQYAHLNDAGGYDAADMEHAVEATNSSASAKAIAESRRILQDQYAHLNDIGDFDAADSKLVQEEIQISRPPQNVSESRQQLQNPYAYLDDAGGFDVTSMKLVSEEMVDASSIHVKQPSKIRLQLIEQTVREIHATLWRKRHQLWPDGVPSDPVDMLDPAVALESIGFDFEMAESLGQFKSDGATVEVAGVIDQSNKKVRISRQLRRNTYCFTAAHELGHAILHEGTGFHRDRPLDGAYHADGQRDIIEKEADKFAVLFLMPEKLVTARFREIFGCERFVLNEDTMFALDPSGSMGLEKSCKTPRDLSLVLAKAERYNRQRVRSLADQFGVSPTAMAIRIEELGLIDT